MHRGSNLKRWAGAVALIGFVGGSIGAFAAPAQAAAGPTVSLQRGTVIITGTAARDVIRVTMNADRLLVDVNFDGTIEAQFQRTRYQALRMLLGEGDDGVSVAGTGDVPVTISGGGGNDAIGAVGNIGAMGTDDALTRISGDGGNDTIFAATPGPITVQAGAGDDLVNGGGAGVGEETILLGDGSDRFVSSLNAFVGNRNDVVDGGDGHDTMAVEGTFAAESVGLSAKAGHLIINHDLRNRVDADNVEDVTYLGFGGLDESGGGDAIAVNDLSGTDVRRFTPNFGMSQTGTVPNNSADTLTVRGTTGIDRITVSGSGANTTVSGLRPTVTPVLLQPEDFLLIDTLDGDDIVDSSGLQPGLVQLLVR